VGGATYNLVNHPAVSASRFKSLHLASWLNLYSARKGVVLRSGIGTLIGHVPQTTYVEWFPAGASVWRRNVLEKYPFDSFFEGYGYLEDLDLSYRVAKEYRLAVVADAQFHNYPSSVGRVDRYLFGKKEVVNRLYFVTKHKELSFFWCLLMLLTQTLMSLAAGVFTSDMAQIRRAFGNVTGLASALARGLKPVTG